MSAAHVSAGAADAAVDLGQAVGRADGRDAAHGRGHHLRHSFLPGAREQPGGHLRRLAVFRAQPGGRSGAPRQQR